MTQVLLSIAARRALRIDNASLAMFEVDSSRVFAPRAHEIEAFFSGNPEEATGDLQTRLDAFEIEVAAADAVECVLAALDHTLSRSTRLSALCALGELAASPEVGDAAVRAFLSRPMDRKLADLAGAIRIAEAAETHHALDVLYEVEENWPRALTLHAALSRLIAQKFKEPWGSLIAQAVRRYEIVGRFLAGDFGGVLGDGGLAHLLQQMTDDLGPDVDADALFHAVVSTLLAARPKPRPEPFAARDIDLPLLAGIVTSEDDRLGKTLSEALGQLVHQLYRAGSLNDESSRWNELLDLCLAIGPDNLDAWQSKVRLLREYGSSEEMQRVQAFMRERFGATDTAITPAGYAIRRGLLRLWTPPGSGFKLQTSPSKQIGVTETRAPSSPRQLLARLMDYVSSAGEKGATAALLDIAGHVEGPSVAQIQSSYTLVPNKLSGGLTWNVSSENRITPDALLNDMSAYDQAREAAGVGRGFKAFNEIVDASVKLSEDELKQYVIQLQLSTFYASNRAEIERLYSRVPSLGIALLGKLVHFDTPTGGFLNPKNAHRFTH